MEISKEDMVEILSSYFGLYTHDGTYTYELTRVKEAFDLGTMSLDDFEEIDEEWVRDLVDHIFQILTGGESGEEITIRAIKPEANRDEARAKNNLRK